MKTPAAGSPRLATGAFLATYSLLPFGLCLPLFRMKVTVFGMVMNDEALSTFGTIDKLHRENHLFPAALILFFSVLVPVLKLSLLMLHKSQACGPRFPLLADLLRTSARWATVDAFVAILLTVVFAGIPAIDLSLKAGFFAFLSYCFLAVLAAQLLPQEVEPQKFSIIGDLYAMSAFFVGPIHRAFGHIMLVASGLSLFYGFRFTCLEVNVPMLGIDRQVVPFNFAAHGNVAFVISILAGVVPVLEIAARFVGHSCASHLADWAMADVLGVANMVAFLILNTLPMTTATLHTGTWWLLAHTVFAHISRRLMPVSNSKVQEVFQPMKIV